MADDTVKRQLKVIPLLGEIKQGSPQDLHLDRLITEITTGIKPNSMIVAIDCHAVPDIEVACLQHLNTIHQDLSAQGNALCLVSASAQIQQHIADYAFLRTLPIWESPRELVNRYPDYKMHWTGQHSIIHGKSSGRADFVLQFEIAEKHQTGMLFWSMVARLFAQFQNDGLIVVHDFGIMNIVHPWHFTEMARTARDYGKDVAIVAPAGSLLWDTRETYFNQKTFDPATSDPFPPMFISVEQMEELHPAFRLKAKPSETA